ncbi:MAG: pyrroline-5-carboxylate reductase [Pseudomonadota bacterium]
MNRKPSIALIGAGAMGGALLRGWVRLGAIDPTTSVVFDPAPSPEVKTLMRDYGMALNPENIEDVGVAIIAVKPQAAAAVLPQFASLAQNAVVLSVMAGKSCATISALLNGAPRVARMMPNLPAAIGRGVSGLYASPAMKGAERAIIQNLASAAGDTVWVDSEEAIDFVTALSGSGPAYCFLLIEALTDAGVALGLPEDAATRLARATFSGVGAMVAADGRSADEMRAAVTSPGGTTEAALKILDGDKQALRRLMEEAVAAAAARAAALTD